MAEEKWKRKLIEQAIVNDALTNSVKVRAPSPAKYKKQSFEKSAKPDIDVGKKCIVRISKEKSSDVDGYLLCQILDYMEVKGRWYSNTWFVVQPLKASQKHLQEWIGRLIPCDQQSGWYSSNRFCVYSFEINNFKMLDDQQGEE